VSPVEPIRFSLPLPPGVNNQYVTLKNGRRSLSPASKKWKRAAQQEVEVMRFDGRIPEAFLEVAAEGFLSLFLDFYFETPLRRDLDGGLKILQDTVCEALGVNDNRVVDIHLVKRMDPLNPRVEVQVEALPEWQFDAQYVYLGSTDTDE
jgi:crossover junction endodeoxyribonuclease RusA